jgi:hypothetical protein
VLMVKTGEAKGRGTPEVRLVQPARQLICGLPMPVQRDESALARRRGAGAVERGGLENR